MGRSRMNCMKITLQLLALCLLLSITTKVSGKPNPRHLLIETEEQAKKTADYKEPGTDYNKAENNYDYQSIQNIGGNTFTNSHFNNNQMNAAGTSATQNVWGNQFTDSHFNNNQKNADGTSATQNVRGNQGTGGHFNNNQKNAGGNTNRAIQNFNDNTFTDTHVNNIQNNNGGDTVMHGSKFNTLNSHWGWGK